MGDFNPNERDTLFEEAARIVVGTQQGSTSMLQKATEIGLWRAGRIMDQLEATGIVGVQLEPRREKFSFQICILWNNFGKI